MIRIATTYHRNLQTSDLTPSQNNKQTIKTVLDNIDTKANTTGKENLSTTLKYKEVTRALMSMPNGKASGLDRIPTEMWKTLAIDYQKATAAGTKENDLPPDFAQLLLTVYNEIENHEIAPESNFAEGWMCPMYKKKDKTDIANYCPITVLNADYKIFTKALTIKLTPVALKISTPTKLDSLKVDILTTRLN
ncbi:hypothetical protein H1R20_g13927, partial [Candolleomyces eurysporus]